MQRMIEKVLNWVFPIPVHCAECGHKLASFEIQLGICRECLDKLRLFSGQALLKMEGLHEQHFDAVYGVALYEGMIKDWIYRMKYYGERQLAFPLVELVMAHGLHGDWDGIIPIPLHRERLEKRGYNQAGLIAEGVAFYLGRPYVEGLARVKATAPQNQLRLSERQANVQGIFALRPGFAVAGKEWLLVDDIFTTGATVNEAAKVLKLGGARRVDVCVLASGRMM